MNMIKSLRDVYNQSDQLNSSENNDFGYQKGMHLQWLPGQIIIPEDSDDFHYSDLPDNYLERNEEIRKSLDSLDDILDEYSIEDNAVYESSDQGLLPAVPPIKSSNKVGNEDVAPAPPSWTPSLTNAERTGVPTPPNWHPDESSHEESANNCMKRSGPQVPRRSPSTRLSSSSESSQLSLDHSAEADFDLSYTVRQVNHHDDTPESGYHTSEHGGSEIDYPLDHGNNLGNKPIQRNSIPYNSVSRNNSNLSQDGYGGNGPTYEYTICPPPPPLDLRSPQLDIDDDIYCANEDYQTHIPTHNDISSSNNIYGQFSVSSHDAYNREIYSTTIVKNSNIMGVFPQQTSNPSPHIQPVPPPPPMSPDMFPPPPPSLQNMDFSREAFHVPATLPKPKPPSHDNYTNKMSTNSASSNTICSNFKQSSYQNEPMQKNPFVAPKPPKIQSTNSSPSHAPSPISYSQSNQSFNDDLSSAESQFKAATQRLCGQLQGIKIPPSNSNTSLSSVSSSHSLNQNGIIKPEEEKKDIASQIQIGISLRPSPKGEKLRVGADFKEQADSALADFPPPPPPEICPPPPPLNSAPPTLPKPTRSEIPIMPTTNNNKTSPSKTSSMDVDVRTLAGYQDVPENAPAWKKAMVEKKNKELEEEYRSKVGQKQQEEERWRGVPEWKKKIMIEKESKKKEEDAVRSEQERKAMMLDEKHADMPVWKKDIIKKKRGDMP